MLLFIFVRKFFIVSYILFLLGCDSPTKNHQLAEEQPSDSNPTVVEFSVPEPFITNESTQENPFELIAALNRKEDRTVQLTGMMEQLENSTFYLDDQIVFSNRKKHKPSNVRFEIFSECIESTRQKPFRRNIEIQYTESIHLVELLPEEIFPYGLQWWSEENLHPPSCSFRFQAKNKEGDIHYFELPHLSVTSFEEGFNLSLVQKNRDNFSNQELIDQFPMLVFDQLNQYSLISGYESSIDELKLICENWSISFPASGITEYDLQTLTGWTQVTENQKINQPCRFISLNQNHVVGVSQLFPMVFPVKDQLEINLQSYQKNPLPLQRGVEGIRDLLSDFEKAENLNTYHQVASLEIKNKSTTAVHLFLPELGFQTDVYFFYDGLRYRNYLPELRTTVDLGRLGFFVPIENGAQFKVKNPMLESKTVSEYREPVVWGDRQAIVTVPADSVLRIPLSVEFRRECRVDLKHINSIGMIFEGKNLPIYQVLNNTNFERAQNTIIDQTHWSKRNQEKTHPFHLELGLYVDDFNKNFYKNTCSAGQRGYFNPLINSDEGSWRVHSRGEHNDGNGRVYFKKSKRNLPTALDKAIRERQARIRKGLSQKQ